MSDHDGPEISKMALLSFICTVVPIDTIFKGRKDKIITQNDFDRFVDFIKLEVYSQELNSNKSPDKIPKHKNKDTKDNSPTNLNYKKMPAH